MQIAAAKINLHLHITGRRPDGYHLLDSLVVFAGASDRLAVDPDAPLSLTIDGPFASALQSEPDNLVLRAARALAAEAGIAPRGAIQLTKNLPIASGIGGGSADAAAALRLLATAWNVPPASPALAVFIGADVPVCLASRPARMQGIGEILLPAPAIPRCGLVLVNPGVTVATPAVFKALTPGFHAMADLPDGWDDAEAMATDLAALANDLEPPAIRLAPEIGAVLAALERTNALLVRMSGSGATCFAIYPDIATAARAANAVTRSGWWVWSGGLAAAPGAT